MGIKVSTTEFDTVFGSRKVIKDRKGQAAALGLDDIKEVCPFLAKQMSAGPGKSKMVKDAPVHEVVLNPAELRIDTFRAFRAAAPGTPVIVMTSLEDDQLPLETLKLGAQDYLSKNDVETGLTATLRRNLGDRSNRPVLVAEDMRRSKRDAIASAVEFEPVPDTAEVVA